jgi:hypothetical protein
MSSEQEGQMHMPHQVAATTSSQAQILSRSRSMSSPRGRRPAAISRGSAAVRCF